MPKSKFIRVACRKCKKDQIVFSKVSILVKCNSCSADLVLPTGGDSIVKGKVLEVLS